MSMQVDHANDRSTREGDQRAAGSIDAFASPDSVTSVTQGFQFALDEDKQGNPAEYEASARPPLKTGDVLAAAPDLAITQHPLFAFATEHFALESPAFYLFRRPQPLSLDTRLRWEKSVLTFPLTKLSRECTPQAIQAFRNISGFMGTRSTGKGQIDHCYKLLRNVFPRSAALRDEVFCQLCKQLTGNPNSTAVRNGWLLFHTCLVTFPPTDRLGESLELFFKMHENDADPNVARSVRGCLDALHSWATHNQRNELPSLKEFQSLRDHTPVEVVVFLLDGTPVSLTACSWTSCRDLTDSAAERLGIRDRRAVALFQTDLTAALARVDDEERVLDVLSFWERMDVEGTSRKNAKPSTSVSTPSQRLVFQLLLFLPIVDDNLEDTRLAYIQAVYNVVHDSLFAPLDTSITLAALQLRVKQLDTKGENDALSLLKNGANFVPPRFLNTSASAEMITKILEAHSHIETTSIQQLHVEYLRTCASLPHFGATIFPVQNTRNRVLPSGLLLAIDRNGIALLNLEYDLVRGPFEYTTIVSWGYSSKAFVFVEAALSDSVEFVLRTKLGKTINDLVGSYVAAIVADAERNI